jgi:capsular exopolysaccharide synthesis family protein
MTPREFYDLFRERWRAVLAGLLIGVLGATGFFLLSPRQYESSVTLFVTSGTSTDPSAALDRNTLSAQRMQTYVEMITSAKVAQQVVDTLELPTSGAELAGRISASSNPETVLLTATATATNPALAAEIANVLADEFIDQVAELERSSDGSAAAVVSARVFDDAVPATTPSSPQLVPTFALGALLGLLAGFGLALLRKALDTSVRTGRGLAGVAGVPVLGTIARDKIRAQQSLVVLDDPRSSFAEAYRQLRTNLRFAGADRAPRVVMLTSSSSGDGTTTVLANLAVAMAESGHRVLLVEADLRRPRAAELFSVRRTSGLTDVLTGGTKAADVVQRGAGGVDVISSGPVPANPGGLLASPAMAQFLDEVRLDYDAILLDASPVLPVADAAVLAPLVDAVVLVVRSGTAAPRVESARDALRAVSAPLLGTVLTMARSRAKRGDSRYAETSVTPSAPVPAPPSPAPPSPAPPEAAQKPPETASVPAVAAPRTAENGKARPSGKAAARPSPSPRPRPRAAVPAGDLPRVPLTHPGRSRAGADAPRPDR